MSGKQMATQSSGGLQPVGDNTEQQAGGVFRLEALAPGAENAEEMFVAPKKAKISTQAITLGVLLVVGGGMIYGMRILGIGPLTTLAKTVVPDYDLTKPAARSGDHKRILADLEANHASGQVPADQVQKNPFSLADLMTPTASATPADNGEAAARAAADRAKRDADAKRKRLQTTLAGLKINGILGGSNPVARISGEAVRVGDTVADMFKVKAIHGRAVELEFEGETFTLQMDDTDMNSTKPKKH